MKLALLLLFSALAFCQQFEVAAVSVSKDANAKGKFLEPSGEFTVRSVDLKSLLVVAYHVQPFQIAGAPSWTDSDHFDITAKAPPQTQMETLRVMLQALLKDRFQLEMHREERMGQAYALTVSSEGSKLKPSDTSSLRTCQVGRGTPGLLHISCDHVTSSELPETLIGYSAGYLTGRPVIDLTGLKGAWEFTLEWTPFAQFNAVPQPPGTVSLFEAVESQLGLQLKEKKLPVPTIVIDKINRVPSDN